MRAFSRSMSGPIILALIFANPSFACPDDPKNEDFNAKVLAFAKSKLGQQVGTGDCTDLLVEAFQDAGARPCKKADDGAYLWGEPVKSYKEAEPGDVVQFEKVVFYGQRRSVGDDGIPRISFRKEVFPHHSAVVIAVSTKAKTITILHQNTSDDGGEPDKTVREKTLRMTELQKGGTFAIFRPVKP